VDVLDAADVVDGVTKIRGEGLALDVADQVTLVPAGVDPVVRIEELHGQDGRILAPHGNGPGIGPGYVVGDLLGIVEDYALEVLLVLRVMNAGRSHRWRPQSRGRWCRRPWAWEVPGREGRCGRARIPRGRPG